jgi:hypothetical protein
MKKIYLALIMLLVGSTTFAQRKCDLAISGGSTSTTVTIDPAGGVATYLNFGFTNNGTDTLKTTDTIHFVTNFFSGSYYLNPIKINPGVTIHVLDTLKYTSGPADGNYTFCDSVWLTSASSDPAVDLVISNNKVCQTLPVVNKTTSIVELDKKQSLTTYPNPAVNELSFEFNFLNNSGATARIYDLAGRTVLVKEFEKNYVGNQKFSLDISSLTTGVYFLEFVVDDTKSISKFNVQK